VQPVLRRPFEAAAQQPADRRRLRGQCREIDLVLEHAGECVGHRVAAEEALAREHLEEHDAESPDVGPPVDREPLRLLGRHVGGGAEDHPVHRGAHGQRRRLGEVRDRARARRGSGGIHGLGKPEVEDLDLPLDGRLDVLGLEVAMDDPLLVGLLQRLGDLARDGETFPPRQGSRLETIRQRRPLDQVHDERAHAVRFFEAEDRRDVRMVELGEELRFALEAREAFRVLGERRRQHLDRHLPVEPGVGRAIDLAHPALAELGGDRVGAEPGAGCQRHDGRSAAGDGIRVRRLRCPRFPARASGPGPGDTRRREAPRLARCAPRPA
jgi:hypothetical protein